MILQCYSGSCSMPNGSSEIRIFHFDRKTKKEEFLGKIGKRSDIELIEKQFIQASNLSADFGKFISAKYQVQDGTILKFYFKSEMRQDGFISNRQCAIYLIARNGAPHYKIDFKLVRHQHLNLTTLSLFGNFDILKPSELHTYGINVPPHFMYMYGAFNVRQTIEITKLRDETDSKPVMETTEIKVGGETHNVSMLKTKRRLVIPRK